MSCLCVWLGKVSGIIVSSCSWESQCLQLSVLVSADYVVQVEMLSYSHPSNTRSVGLCCDSESGNGPCSGDERCDTFFTYCLMPRASTAIVCPNTAPGFFAISLRTAQNGATIDFSQPTVLGLPNPFNLTGLTTSWEVVIIVLVHFNLHTISCYCRELISFTFKWVILMTIFHH